MAFREKLTAYVAPMGVFVGLLGLDALLPYAGQSFWLQHPEYWLFPTQTVICGILLCRYWNLYELGSPKQAWFGPP